MSKAIYSTISELFSALAIQYSQLSEHHEMTGSEYISELDRPDAGGDEHDATNGADVSAKFNSGADVAAVFTPAPAAPEPIYTMTAAAGEWTREQLLASGNGWTDELLVSQGMMTVTYPKPAAPTPPAPPAPPAPGGAPTPPAAGTPTPAGIETDNTGLPWDARIHSGGRTKKANGEWVAKKNVNAALVAQVTAELRQLPAGGTPFAQPPAAHVPLAPSAAAAAPSPAPAPPAPGAAGMTKEQALAAAQAAAELEAAKRAAPPQGNAPVPTDARSLMEWVSSNGHGPNMNKVATMLGLPGFGLILQPENAHHVQTAYHTFLALAQPTA